jgi:hypothetical protein
LLGALEMQFEDGGNNGEVNDLLLAALKAGVRHQVGEQQALAVFRALNIFAQAEAERWRQVQAGSNCFTRSGANQKRPRPWPAR